MNSQAELFFKKVRLESSKVQYPNDVVFLCGGEINHVTGTIKSLRDFIFKTEMLLPRFQVLLAEKAATAYDSKIYDDLLEFERYIASISRIVLLISESAGSIAELGAFSQISEIRAKLLVFMHSKFYGESSFIKDGPVRFLENLNEQSVQEFTWTTSSAGNLAKASVEPLATPIELAVEGFMRKQPRTEKFDKRRIGHQILLVAGVIYTLRCCKLREILKSLELLGYGLTETELKKCIFCLKLFGWIQVVKRETNYYIYEAAASPFIFRGIGSLADFDPVRVRHDVLKAYPDNDPRLTVLDSVIV